MLYSQTCPSHELNAETIGLDAQKFRDTGERKGNKYQMGARKSLVVSHVRVCVCVFVGVCPMNNKNDTLGQGSMVEI